jgi:hypothetical protein
MGWYLALVVGTVITIGEWIAYFAIYYGWLNRWQNRLRRDVEPEIRRLSGLGTVLHELWSSAGRRENSMILMGSLFIPTAFAILIVGAAPPISISQPARVSLLIVSVFLYSWWLFTVQLTTRIMNDLSYDMQRISEGNAGPGHILKELYGDRQGKGSLTWLRRNHWLAYLPLLIFPSVVIIFNIYGI